MHLTQFPVLLFVWTMTAGFTRGKNTTKQPGEEANAPQRRQGPLLAGRGFLPRPGPASFPGPQKRNDTDAIVIEHGDGDNSKLPPFIFRPVPIIPPRTCQKEHSCLNRCSNTRQFQNVTAKKKFFSCFCDPECHTIFHDCCADYERYCQESGAQGHENNTAEMKKWDCLMVKGKDLGIWMIKTCAKDWPSDEARLKCENMSNKLGLEDDSTLIVDEFHNIFANLHCAKCNHVENFSYVILELKNNTAKNTSKHKSRAPKISVTKKRSFANERLPISLNQSSHIGLRYCYKIRSSCKDKANSTAALKCREGKTGLVTFKKETYRNFHCLKCYHRFSFGLFPPKVLCGPQIASESRISLASMLRIPYSPEIDKSRCSRGSFYDNTARACRKLLSVSELDSNQSSFPTKYAINLRYKRNPNFDCFGYKGDFIKNLTKDNISIIRGELSRAFNDAFMRKIEHHLRNTDWTLSGIVIYVDKTEDVTVLFQNLATKSDMNETELFSPVKFLKLHQINFLYDLYNASSLCSYSLIAKSSQRMKCLDKQQSNVTVSMEKATTFDNGTIFYRPTGQMFKPGEYILFKCHNQTKLATCKTSTPANCKHILKSDSNWKLLPNQSIYSNATKTWFKFGEYSIVDNVAWLCFSKSTSSEGQSKTVHEIILTYASIVCLSISILSLTVLLFIYSITPALRNLPGKNLMLLCCVLAFAHLLWLFQERAFQFHKACVALSIALHFLFLASFSCSTSIAVLTFLTFRAIGKGKFGKSGEGNTFLRYALFSLGFPSAWVFVFGLLDNYGVLSLEYGSIKGYCWLGNVKGLYISFITPLFTLLCINLGLLFVTVNMIRKCSQANKKLVQSAKSSVQRNHVWIYIRMATLMGFTWLLAVFQLVFPRVLVFDYLFVFVNGLQGFYIALAFLFTDNVKKILSKRSISFSGKTGRTCK